MSAAVSLDEFLKSQSSQSAGFTATLEPIPEKPAIVKITPFRDDYGCGCSSSFELPKTMIRSVTPTGKFHYCCGKRLEVAVIEFTENASVPVADLMKRMDRPSEPAQAVPPYSAGGMPVPMQSAAGRSRLSSGLVGRWPIPGGPCEVVCIEVCTRFCGPTGWACCEWETRCGINCSGNIA